MAFIEEFWVTLRSSFYLWEYCIFVCKTYNLSTSSYWVHENIILYNLLCKQNHLGGKKICCIGKSIDLFSKFYEDREFN